MGTTDDTDPRKWESEPGSSRRMTPRGEGTVLIVVLALLITASLIGRALSAGWSGESRDANTEVIVVAAIALILLGLIWRHEPAVLTALAVLTGIGLLWYGAAVWL